MMNERGAIGIVIGIIVAVAVVGGAAAWYYTQSRGGVSVSPSPTLGTLNVAPSLTQTPAATAGSFTGKITDLVKQGQNLSCTFQHADQASTVNGTVYVATEGQRLRTDFSIQPVESAAITAHMVRQGQTLYLWSDQLAQGTKFTVTEEGDAAASQENSQQVLAESFSYQCQPWLVNESVFGLPSSVQFVDVTAQIQQLQTGTGAPLQPNAQQCASCNQLQEPSKTQCLQALGC